MIFKWQRNTVHQQLIRIAIDRYLLSIMLHQSLTAHKQTPRVFFLSLFTPFFKSLAIDNIVRDALMIKGKQGIFICQHITSP